MRKGSSLNFDFKSNSEFKYKYFSLEPNNKYGHRLILDIYLIKKKLSPRAKKIKKPKIIIAIDAGHGGRDPGAVGKNGTKEKDIVLSISKKLYNLLRKEKKIKPVLIRSGDKYISLRKRIEKARKYKADLLFLFMQTRLEIEKPKDLQFMYYLNMEHQVKLQNGLQIKKMQLI